MTLVHISRYANSNSSAWTFYVQQCYQQYNYVPNGFHSSFSAAVEQVGCQQAPAHVWFLSWYFLTFANCYCRYLAHVSNLATSDTMGMITKKAALETSQAIWEDDPMEPSNRVLGGSLDVIAALCTLATKIQASRQQIQEFHKIQKECGIVTPLWLILHGNTRWGSAFGMVDRALKLSKVCHNFSLLIQS